MPRLLKNLAQSAIGRLRRFCESLEMRWYGYHCGCTVPQGACASLCNFDL